MTPSNECTGAAGPIQLKGLHRRRTISHLGVRQIAGWQVKLYGIALADGQPRPDLVRAAIDTAAQVLPAPARQTGDDGPDRYGVGFCIVHDANGRCYVLLDWWAAENEIHQRMFSAPGDTPDALVPHPGDAIGCVWELAVTDFERRAWLRHVLANRGVPDIDAYLRTAFNGKV